MPIEFATPRPPLPPTELMSHVTDHFGLDRVDARRSAWWESGESLLRGQELALASIRREFSDFERMLDFGCGPGRSLGLMQPAAATTELHGVDIDTSAIDWASKNLPFAHWHLGPHEPPLEFEDGFFDLVTNYSVFTHLDAHYQDLWLAELRRIVRPGGVLLLTVHGERMAMGVFKQLADSGEDPEPYQRALSQDGILFFEDDTFVGSVHPPFYHSTFHAPWYVFSHWGKLFTIRAYIPGGSWDQDLVVLERPAGSARRSRRSSPPLDAGARRGQRSGAGPRSPRSGGTRPRGLAGAALAARACQARRARS